MTFAEAMERLAALGPEVRVGRAADRTPNGPVPRKFALEHMRSLLTALDEPQRRFPAVLIAGTNGKGSTAATLASITHAAGVRTGLYTSPHLERVTERIRISAPGGLEEIPGDAFGEAFGRVDAAALDLVRIGGLPHYPSYFEVVTAAAFCFFAAQRVELAVLEVGLGGRLDATNAADPLVSIITDIGIDHTEYLGHTLREIATEKAGILRQDGVLVTLSQHPEANAAIGEKALALNVRGVDAARCLPGSFSPGVPGGSSGPHAPERGFGKEWASAPGLLQPNRYAFSIDGEVVLVDSPLAGQHQQRNIALAVAAAIELRTNHGFVVPNAAIEAGIRATVWPGRLEWVPGRDGHAPLLLDVAHNPAGAWTLRAALAQLPEAMPRTLIFSSLADKPIEEMAQVLLPLFDSTGGDPARARDHVILAPVQNARAATLEELLAVARKLDVPAHGAPHLAAALTQAQAITPADGLIVATGSLFLVGEVRALLIGDPDERGALAPNRYDRR